MVVVWLPAVVLGFAVCRTPRSAWRLGGRAVRVFGALTGLGPDVRFADGASLPDRPFVVVSNHASLLDVPILIGALQEPAAFTSKREVFDWPLVGRFARRIGAVPVERSSVRRRAEAFHATAAELRAGRTVHVFPESTYSPGPGLLPFRLGAFRLASEHGLPVVPVALVGTRRCLPPGALLPRPGRIEVHILPPVVPPPPEAGRSEGLGRFRDEVRRALAGELSERHL